MTKLLTEVLQKIAELPAGSQDDAARTLLTLLENDARRYRLTDTQVREVELAMQEADRGEFASDREMKDLWRSFGV